MPFKKTIQDIEISRLGLASEIHFYQTIAIDQLDCKNLVAVVFGIPDIDFNLVVDTHTTHHEIREKIDQVITFFQHYRVPWRWVVHSLSRPVALSRYLKQKGFVLGSTDPMMYFDLDTLLPPRMSTVDWEIREIGGDDLTDWVKPIIAAVPKRNDSGKMKHLYEKIQHGPGTSLRHYVGYYHGQPVTSLTLFVDSYFVGLHNVATHPDFGRKGFAKKLVIYVMLEAKKMGFKHCFLASSKAGYKLYRRIGFQIYDVHKSYLFNVPL